MQERDDDGAAIHDDLLAARARLDEADLSRGAAVKPAKDKPEEDQESDYGNDDDAKGLKFHD